MWIHYLMCTGCLLIVAVFFLPVFYKLRAICVHEYFERRFNSVLIRRYGATLFIIQNIALMSVVMYAPAVALSAVAKTYTWPFILSVGVVCTFYTSLGGLTAVIWTDSIQVNE